jgi:hypothetical protein
MKENATTLAAALEAIFDQPAQVKGSTVKAVLTQKELTPTQFLLLAQTSMELNLYPTILRSGAGVSVIYS